MAISIPEYSGNPQFDGLNYYDITRFNHGDLFMQGSEYARGKQAFALGVGFANLIDRMVRDGKPVEQMVVSIFVADRGDARELTLLITPKGNTHD